MSALLLVPLSWWVLYRTRFGLRLRAVGENPAAVDTAGVSVVRLRYAAVMITGRALRAGRGLYGDGLAGGLRREMTAGRGYIALAALIFAKWRPWYCAVGDCLLFGFLQALALRPDVIESVVRRVGAGAGAGRAALYPDGAWSWPGLVGKAIPPRAGGEPYVKER